MSPYSWLQLIFYLVVLLALAKPLGSFMARVYLGERTFLDPVLGPVERLIYRLCGVKPEEEMNWKVYAVAVMLFNGLGLIAVYGLQRLQAYLPLNPQSFGAVSPDSAWNTAVSFATNTNWQGYGGETTMSYLTQMAALTVQNFVSAATGMAVMVALIRGIARHTTKVIGNFWVDLTRSTLYILLPLSLGARARARFARGRADFQPVQNDRAAAAHDQFFRPRGDPTNSGGRAGRVADRDQAARHERRRLFQHQFGAPVREPHAAVQLPGNAFDPADPGGAGVHLRQNGGRHAPGLGNPGDDDHSLCRHAGDRRMGRTERQPGAHRPGSRSDR